MLILFAAGLVAHGIHEFEEAGVVNGIIEPLYSISNVMSEDGLAGSFMKGMFGYNPSPSLLQAIFYVSYLALIFFLYRRIENSKIKVGA